MLILLSPAKKFDFETIPIIKESTQAELLLEASSLITILKKKSPTAISKLMKLSPSLSQLNHQRYQNWEKIHTHTNAKQALLAFYGDVYLGLQAYNFQKSDFSYAQKHLRIISGLYGLLKPLDLIQPYRLEMGTQLKTKNNNNLYHFWGKSISQNINTNFEGQYIVNLASQEYSKAINKKHIKLPIYDVTFLEKKGDDYKNIGFVAKKSRGIMARWIIKNKIDTLDVLKNFKEANYTYSTALSTDTNLVFIRKYK